MSSLEPLTTKLTTIRHLIAAGDKETALDLLNQFLKEHNQAEAHSLRLRILVDDMKDIFRIHESLNWLERHHPAWESLPMLVTALHTKLESRVGAMRESILEYGGSGQIAELDELIPLADRFPVIYLVRGLAFADAARPVREASSPFRLPRPSERRPLDRLPKHKSEELPKQAEQSFERAITLLPAHDPAHREAIEAIAMLHEDITGDLKAALIWYKRGLALGIPVEEKIMLVQRGIVKQTVTRFAQHLDGLISRHQFDKAAGLIDASDDLQGLPSIQVRRADLALLRGDAQQAESLYQTLLDTLQKTLTTDIGDFEMEQVFPLMERLPKDILVPIDSHLPCVRYLVDYNDIGRRTQVGLIAVYQHQGQYDRVYEMIRQMLQDQTMTAKTTAILLDDLNQTEVQIQQQKSERLQAQIPTLWEAKNWRGLIQTCRQLTSLPGAQPSDFAWLAAAMYKAGENPDAIIFILNRVQEMGVLPAEVARALLRDLSNAGYWRVTDSYVASVANAGGWRTRYYERRAAFIETTLAQAEQAFKAGEINFAENHIRSVLELESQDARARLLHCRIQFAAGKPSLARTELLKLVDDEAVGREAVLALAEIDIADGYLLDARKRLDELARGGRDARLDALVRSLEHRIDRTPVIEIEAVKTVVSPDTLRRTPAAGTWAATFAVRLTGVRAVRQPPSVDQACAELLTALCRVSDNLGLQTLFAWRYIGHKGSLRIALMCRVEGASSEENARLSAEALWDTLRGLLPLQDEQIYAYEPVMGVDELEYLRMPEKVESAVEIVRKESLISVSENDDVYLMYPFAFHDGNMHRLLRTLAEQPETTILDIHFQPTLLLPWERTAIKNMMDVDVNNSPDSGGGLGFMGNFSSQGDERYQQAQYMYPEFLRHTQWMAFVVRIHLVTKGNMNSVLPNIAATGLFGPSRYEIAPANFERDLEVIASNLHDVNCERWGYSAAPNKLERLRYLLMPAEALTATRIPLPGADGLPGLPALKIKAAPLPSNLPQNGVSIGESVTPVQGRPMTIRANLPDRLRHTYVVGRTGTGKSTLLQNLALQDIEAGRGVGIIDPHGDLVEAILERIPPHRLQDVVLFDPSDTERPVGLNILDVDGTFEKNMVVAEFIGLMYSMFDPHKIGIVGPRFENAVRNAMLTAMEVPGSTLIEVVRILSDRKYLQDCLEVISDPVVKSYWRDIVGNQSDFHKSEVLDYITSKFGRFVTDHLVRNIIGQSQNALNFSEIMDNGRILLVNLAKGKIGPQNSHFLGLLLVPRLLIAALSRAHVDVGERRLFSLYVDEFHNFTTPAFGVMLSEARKYGVALTVANQFISQLEDSIRESVFGNVGTLLTFQVGVKDAHYLVPEMYPVFDVDDMVNLPNFHLLAKMLINGNVAPQFPVRTLPDSRVPDSQLGEIIRSHSRQRYGRDSFIVGHEIQQRFNQTPKERLAK